MKKRFPSEKIMTLEQAVAWREKEKVSGRTVACTNGCFDIIHRGHTTYLAQAAETADNLVLLINSDASVRRLKGPERPKNAEYDRAFVAASLESVDAVVIFDADRCDRELAALAPDVYVKGGDYTVEKLDPTERKALEKAHAKFVFIDFVKGYSTTNIINKMKNGDEK